MAADELKCGARRLRPERELRWEGGNYRIRGQWLGWGASLLPGTWGLQCLWVSPAALLGLCLSPALHSLARMFSLPPPGGVQPLLWIRSCWMISIGWEPNLDVTL